MTWHEDRGISPGVPDLHYVIDHDCVVGWLELKSIDTLISGSRRIKVEPSQHQYIRKWGELMPIHFLIRAKTEVFLVESKWHAAIPECDSNNSLLSLSVASFPQGNIGDVLPQLLKIITRR